MNFRGCELMSVLDKNFIDKLKKNTIFVIVYTLLFVLIVWTFPYIAPFFIATILAIIINPISDKLYKKFNINKGISTLIFSFLGVVVFILLTIFLLRGGTKELIDLSNNISNNNSYFNATMKSIGLKIQSYMEYFEGVSNTEAEDIISQYSQNIMSVVKDIISKIVGFTTSIPYMILFIITLFMSTYFIAKDLDKLESGFFSIFSSNTKSKVKKVNRELRLSVRGYIRAYFILMSITFLVIWITFTVFSIPYAFALGIIGALLDLIPFLGIVVIFLPVIIYHFIMKNYFIAIFITIVFIVLSIVRQILEPKLVSVNIGIDPLSTIVAIFIGIQIRGIIGIIFFLGLIVMHNIFKKVDIL